MAPKLPRPTRSHYDVFFAPERTEAALPFLNGETRVKTWEEQLATGK